MMFGLIDFLYDFLILLKGGEISDIQQEIGTELLSQSFAFKIELIQYAILRYCSNAIKIARHNSSSHDLL